MIFTRYEMERRIEMLLKDMPTSEGTVVHSFYKSGPIQSDVDWGDEKLEAPSFEEVLVKGPAVFRRGDEGWEGQRIESPTVADLIRATQTSMNELQDHHHVFLEGFVVDEVKGSVTPCKHCGRGENEPEVTFIDIYMGS